MDVVFSNNLHFEIVILIGKANLSRRFVTRFKCAIVKFDLRQVLMTTRSVNNIDALVNLARDA